MGETKLDIYKNRDKWFDSELERLRTANISAKNKALITEFQNYTFSRGTKERRVIKLSAELRAICRWLQALEITRDLDKLTKKDAVTLVAFINKLKEKSEATRADYRRAIKQFYRWYKEEDPRIFSQNEQERVEAQQFYHYWEKEVSISYKRQQADPNTILTDDDAHVVVENGASTPKEKAFISLLHETGCRAAEFLNLTIGSIIIKESYAEISVPDCKTGKRTVYATKSLPYLLRYMDVHPYKNNTNSFLWLCDPNNREKANQPMMHVGGQRLIKRCFEKTGIKKRCNWHWFRHSRATILAPKLTEAILCKFMGWKLGSRQVQNYVHLCNKQLEDAFLSMNGLKSQEEAEHPIKCICGALNGAQERYCFRCYRPLNVAVAIQDNAEEVKELKMLNAETVKTVQFFMELSKDPDLKKRIEQFKEKMQKRDVEQ